MNLVQRHSQVQIAHERVERDVQQLGICLLSKPTLETPEFSLSAKSVHLGVIGGDFFWFDYLDTERKRLGVILGDGEGHGIPGALQMLPLFTTFRAVMRHSPSTKYVLEKMHAVAQDVEVAGTDKPIWALTG